MHFQLEFAEADVLVKMYGADLSCTGSGGQSGTCYTCERYTGANRNARITCDTVTKPCGDRAWYKSFRSSPDYGCGGTPPAGKKFICCDSAYGAGLGGPIAA